MVPLEEGEAAAAACDNAVFVEASATTNLNVEDVFSSAVRKVIIR